MRIVPYTSEHADELRTVCIGTASERARSDATHAAFTLLMYCDPYLEHGVAYMLLDNEDVARGYVLCAEDFDAWRSAFEPYRKQIEALGPEYAGRVADELAYYESVKDTYPAHLHIDILEPYTGGGNGRKLMDTLLDRLRSDGVAGVSFGVAASNARAIGFYEHMGFKRLIAYGEGEGDNNEPGGYTFGMRL